VLSLSRGNPKWPVQPIARGAQAILVGQGSEKTGTGTPDSISTSKFKYFVIEGYQEWNALALRTMKQRTQM